MRHADIAQIVDGTIKEVDDELKSYLISNRQPSKSFQFPPKIYQDKRQKSGQIQRHCLHDWFDKFTFLAYSESLDGLFCLCCVLFPVRAHQGTRAKNLIEAPYQNWKKALEDFKTHSCLEYHKDSMARMQAFLSTSENTASRIENKITSNAAATIERNRRFLKSILRVIEYLGRQGLALRGHRDDGNINDDEVINKGNFKALLNVMCDTDEPLRSHLETCKKNATYISKTTKNSLLDCIRDFFQGQIIEQVMSQDSGPFYGLVADEVTDSANWEQLGIVVRYMKDNIPVEKLLEYVKCEDIRGETIADLIINCFMFVI